MYIKRISYFSLMVLFFGVGEGNHLYFHSAVVYSNVLCFLNSKYTEETIIQMEHMQIMLTKKYFNYIQKYKNIHQKCNVF